MPPDNAQKDKAPEFYCPGCGRRYRYMTECRGLTAAQPHAPIEVVSADELKGDDTSNHTPAPGTV